MGTKKTVVATDLGQLSAALEKRGLKLSVPQVRSVPNLKKLEGTIQEKAQVARGVAEDVANAVMFLFEVLMQLNNCQDKFERKTVLQQTAQAVKDMEDWLNQMFDLEDSVFRSVVAVAYIKASFACEYKTYEHATTVLAKLKERRLLFPTTHGQILVGCQRYGVGEEYGLDESDVEELTAAARTFSSLLVQLEKEERQIKAVMIDQRATITLDDARDGKEGLVLMVVPPETFTDRGGIACRRPGGKMLVEFTGDVARPIEAVGQFQDAVQSIVSAGVEVGQWTLGWDNPPGHNRESWERMCEAIKKSRRLNDEEAEAFVKKIRVLWYLVKRGIRCYDATKAGKATESGPTEAAAQ